MVVKCRGRGTRTSPIELLEAAARVLAEEGRAAVTARRLATEVGASTMAVYTHFGSMDELLIQLWREGFARFGAALDGPAVTDDPVADWVAQGWAYRRFALDNRHLYRVMFGDGLVALRDRSIRRRWRRSCRLLRRLQRCADDGRLVVDDVQLAGEVVWASVHGHMTIELTGYFESMRPRRAARLCRGHAAARARVWRSAPGTRRLDARRLAQVAPPAARRSPLRCGAPSEG